MSNKLKKLRKILLGNELYEECKNYAIDKDVLSLRLKELKKDPKVQKRLNELKITNLCLKDCDVDMLINASIFSEYDNTSGVSPQVMLGKVPNCGSGNFDIILDEEHLMELIKNIKQTKEK